MAIARDTLSGMARKKKKSDDQLKAVVLGFGAIFALQGLAYVLLGRKS